MRCKTCNYRLWNLAARRCPECGTPFAPSEFEFVPHSVQFCCPHCNQSYYGTGDKGHLVPLAFTCISCGKPLQMDEMVLRPTTGLEEEQTAVDKVPWIERGERGRVKAWWRTVGMALVSPARLMRALPADGTAASGWGFAILTLFLTLLIAALPLCVFSGVSAFGFGGRATGAGVGFCLGFGLVTIGGGAVATLLVVLWGLAAHGLLRLTGPTAFGRSRTYQALCFSSGANVISGIPCLGPYVGWIWWLISALLMLREGQRVSGGRAALAVLTFPLGLLLTTVALYVWFVIAAVTSVSAFAAMNSSNGVQETQPVLTALLAYAHANTDRSPPHALQLVVDGYLDPNQLFASASFTRTSSVIVGGQPLRTLPLADPNLLAPVAVAAAVALPADTTAHRLGDFVFTYHGVDLTHPDTQLWLVLRVYDPDSNPQRQAGGSLIAVGTPDGQVREFPSPTLPFELARQNVLRAQYNLAPLTDPTLVTHSNSARARAP